MTGKKPSQGKQSMSSRYGHDSEDRHLSKSELSKLRVKLGRERPARPSSAKAADKTDSERKAKKPKARSAHPPPRESGERFARPAMKLKQAIVRAVLNDPDASLADLSEAMDDLGYEVSDFTLGVIKTETQYFIRQAEELGLFIRR
jgi:hypothetical protein